MIDTMKSYPEYKDSGLPWLGSIPHHWDCLPHRAIFEEINEQGHENEPLLSVTIGRGIIRQEDLLAESSKKDSSNIDKSKYKLVEPGDIAYNKMRAWQGAVGVSRYRGIVSPAYIVQRLQCNLKPEYFHYLLRTPGFAKEAERWSYGITSDQWSLRQQHFKMIYSCVPPLDEQELIVGFLNEFDRKVRRFIRNRRRLIEVLNEQKQAIINQAVTRGIAPDVPLKSSGVDWFGEIPEKWKMASFGRFLCGIDQGWSPVAAEGGVTKNQWVVLTLSCLRKGIFDPNAFKPISHKASVPDHLEVYDGDMLISRSNTRQLVGDCCIVKTPRPRTIISDLIYRLRIKENVLYPKFVLLWLLSKTARRQIEIDARGSSSTMVKLSHRHIKSWKIPLPRYDEQFEIVEKVERILEPIHRAIRIAESEIKIVREYRTRLISDVVTGNIDVRHLVPQPGIEDLEETFEALEPLEDVMADVEMDDKEDFNESD
jgi:type I restriction enzyme S subunit